jgi:hypothetical protein
MSVLMSNTRLGLRRRQEGARNIHGERMTAGWGEFEGPYDGRANELTDGTWGLGVGPELWPVRQGDLILDMNGSSWLVQSSDLIQNAFDPYVDWVRISALHRTTGGTEPGGGWFVARYSDSLEPPPPDPSGPVYEAGLWTGYGPPPEAGGDFTPEPGDEYLDLNTGIVYVLEGT